MAPRLCGSAHIAENFAALPVITPGQPVMRGREQEMGASNGNTTGEHQTITLARNERSVNGAAKCDEQPSGNSTAPMALESALQTNHQHHRQHRADCSSTEIVPIAARTAELSIQESAFPPAMSMVKERDFGEIPGTHKPALLKPGSGEAV
jgi:hypothetical protein